MSEHRANSNSNVSHVLIDLTQSDEEDDLRLEHRPRLVDVPTKSQPSHDGLPRSFQFNGGRRSDAGGAYDARSHGLSMAPTASSSMQGTRRVSSSAVDPFRAGSTGSRTTALAPQKRSATVSTGQNTPKRQKIRAHAATPGIEKMVSPSANLVMLQQSPSHLNHERHVTKPSQGPTQNHSVSGNNRRFSNKNLSWAFADGGIRKPKPHPQAQIKSAEQRERITNVLISQFHPKISSAVKQHCAGLSNEHRKEIGSKAAGALVSDSTFVENLIENDWKLSTEYLNKVSVWADALVKHYATEALALESQKRSENGSMNGSASNHRSAKSTEPAYEVDSRASKETTNGPVVSSDTSAVALDPQDISEEEALNPRAFPPQFSRSPSSSPPTSISANSIDRLGPASIEHSDGYKSPTSSPRKTRASRRSTNLPQSQTLLLNVSSGESSSSVASSKIDEARDETDSLLTQEIQNLRLVGLDIKTPRPYINHAVREDLRRGFDVACNRGNVLSANARRRLEGYVLHVDFCSEEIEHLASLMRPNQGSLIDRDPLTEIKSLLHGRSLRIPGTVRTIMDGLDRPSSKLAARLLSARGKSAIIAFLEDVVAGKLPTQPQIHRLQSMPRRTSKQHPRSISSLLREREVWGRATSGISRSLPSFKSTLVSSVEDTIVRQGEWIDCCGDISTLSWTSDNAFVCGATAHSDAHNMQYNKPGNLLVGSISLGTLRAVPDHRITRPVVSIVQNAENSLHSMRQTQDPWLYTSVVSSSHSNATGISFTASFDKTVKLWTVQADGSSMDIRGTWEHEEKVNFVVSSAYHRLVATAADVSNNAIRVYTLDEDDISRSSYDTYTGDRAYEQSQELRRRDNWAYFPATIQWGKMQRVSHLLLVGYSPRSVTGEDSDIPDDKKNTGELCLWNAMDGMKVPIISARTQNVFEVIWHPSQPIFIAATSPCGMFEPETRTQIQVFAQNKLGAFLQIKSLDCPAFDINELTIMPNSNVQSYVTASCTDGNTYVWDTAYSDRPIHVLGHSESLDNPLHDLPREVGDTGVKFAAWGKTPDRFYTGSSDGILKAWDIKAPRGKAFVRNVLSVSGGITSGTFSQDFSKLLLGDATGKVHLLGIDNTQVECPKIEVAAKLGDAAPTQPNCFQHGYQSTLRHQGQRPKSIIPHPEPEPPHSFDQLIEASEQTAQEIARQFILNRQLALHPDRTVGAVQGQNYHETQFYRRECHVNGDSNQPLLPEWQARQHEVHLQQAENEFHLLPEVISSNPALHARNLSLDFDISRLSLASQEELAKDRVDLGFEDSYTLDYELVTPRSKIFSNRISKGVDRVLSNTLL